MAYRGSRKHVLDWTQQPTFAVELLQLASPATPKLTGTSRWMPRGYREPQEARLESFGPDVFPSADAWEELQRWWLVHRRGANTPNWDLAVHCEVEGRPGFILVEAKANVPEMSASGKTPEPDASDNSRANHERITNAIAEARDALRVLAPDTRIAADSHYQLSNRVAFAWKLASLGFPTVLIYLGFTGDTGIGDAGAPFTDAAHFRSAFMNHAAEVLPSQLLELRIDTGSAPFWILVRARRVIEPSPLATSRVT